MTNGHAPPVSVRGCREAELPPLAFRSLLLPSADLDANEHRLHAVVGLLRGHGVPAAAATKIAQAGDQLRQRTAAVNVEFASLFEWDSGAIVGVPLVGGEDRIDLAPQMAALRPGRRYVQLHTHPGSSSFSHHDLSILLRHPELRMMAIVGQHGSWYILSRRRGQPLASEADGLDLWHVHYAEVAEPNDPLIRLGMLTEREALRRELHETMRRLAPEIGLRYDHLEALR
jgi:hypothetical protein